MTAVARKLQIRQGQVLLNDSSGVVTSGIAEHVVCGESLSPRISLAVKTAQKMNLHVVVMTTAWIDGCKEKERLVSSDDCVLLAPVPHETLLREIVRRKESVKITGHQVAGERETNWRGEMPARLTRIPGAG